MGARRVVVGDRWSRDGNAGGSPTVNSQQPKLAELGPKTGGIVAFDFETKPKFATFDMNGTLIQFRINDAIR